MLSLKFFGLVIILVMLIWVIMALWNDENSMYTEDYLGAYYTVPTDDFDPEMEWILQHEEYWYEYEEKELR